MVNGLLAAGENPAQVIAALPDLIQLEDAINSALAGTVEEFVEDIPS
jgi:hypothetical protein